MDIKTEAHLEALIEDRTRQLEALYAKGIVNWSGSDSHKVVELTKERAQLRDELRDLTDLDDQQDAAFEAARDAGTFEPDDGWMDRRFNDESMESESIIATMRNIKALSDAILNDQEAACTRS
jgi:hypothetical protein